MSITINLSLYVASKSVIGFFNIIIIMYKLVKYKNIILKLQWN